MTKRKITKCSVCGHPMKALPAKCNICDKPMPRHTNKCPKCEEVTGISRSLKCTKSECGHVHVRGTKVAQHRVPGRRSIRNGPVPGRVQKETTIMLKQIDE